jgi:hypothetical protein
MHGETVKSFDYVLKLRKPYSEINPTLYIVRLHNKKENEPKFLFQV